MSVEEFITYLQDHIAGGTDTLRSYTAQEMAAIDRLCREKYSTWQWNYGNSPRYGLNQTTRPTEEVEQALTGLPHSHDAVLSALSALPLTDYFGPAAADELTELFF